MPERSSASTLAEDPALDNSPTTHASTASARRTVFVAASATLAVAAAFNLAVSVSVDPRHQVTLVMTGTVSRFPIFVLGTVLIAFGFAVLWAVLGRFWLSIWIGSIMALGVMLATLQKVEARREPLFPSDLHFLDNAGFLLGMTTTSTRTVAIVALLLSGAAAAVAAKRSARRFPRLTWRHPEIGARIIVMRVAVLLVAGGVLLDASHFNSGSSLLRSTYNAAGANWRPANQVFNFQLNGYVGGFLSNLNVEPMALPRDYSRAEMRRIVQRYSAIAERQNLGTKSTALADVNVVLILGEALSDPKRVNGVSFQGDPIPFVRSMMATSPSGNLLTQKLGAGTANVEFEALTGLSLSNYAPEADTPYQMVIPGRSDFPSAVSLFNDLGYRSVAIHPYLSNMYQRSTVYPILGFDEFIDKDAMTFDDVVEGNTLVSDDATFRELEKVIADSDRPVFANVVTMQNHYDYVGKYRNPPHVTGTDGYTQKQLGGYLRGLEYADDAVARLVASLSKSDEKTVIAYYGDHLPAAYSNKVIEANSVRTMRETPFFLWSNFMSFRADELPTTSPTQLVPLLLKYLGAPVSPYYAMLTELRGLVPAMSHEVIVDASNRTSEKSDLSAATRQVLHDYRLVQYDFSVGKGYAMDMLTPLP